MNTFPCKPGRIVERLLNNTDVTSTMRHGTLFVFFEMRGSCKWGRAFVAFTCGVGGVHPYGGGEWVVVICRSAIRSSA